MGTSAEASGPDFSAGIPLSDLPDECTIAGRVGDQAVLLSRIGGELFAVSGVCTHYGAALATGLVADCVVRCPLHHACFDLKTGAARSAPAFDPLAQWVVEIDAGLVVVRRKVESQREPARAAPNAIDRIVIIGGGGAGMACAQELRTLGYLGSVTMLSGDEYPPYDRPNLSKDYLAGTAPEEWLPLRPGSWFKQNAVELHLGADVQQIDTIRRHVRTRSGREFPYDRLLIATGSEPVKLESRGFERENVFSLRSIADARGIASAAVSSARAVVIGSSFVGMEVAAALRQRGVNVTIVSLERVPFAGLLGEEVGKWLQRLHESNGVRFHLNSAAAAFDGRTVTLVDRSRLEADFVVVGVGVRPRVELARSAGILTAGGIRVDRHLESCEPGIFAAGDIAEYPDPISRQAVRIEHWVLAQRQGQVAAANMLGFERPFTSVPFFWTEQFGVAIRYVGHAGEWDEVRADGDVRSGEFVARYFAGGVHRASAGVARDRDILRDERAFELMAGASCGSERPQVRRGPKCIGLVGER